ncbi:hypothetical protein [Loktanella sp. Alg231-35]|uniref:hypothetical protein n=1 Tax=Loktanella sp. Alg231-35 TaxID=1922220 RepID=UPI000D54BDF6|nr:hypothetical protein [Loktanella sp. Alg231-35]
MPMIRRALCAFAFTVVGETATAEEVKTVGQLGVELQGVEFLMQTYEEEAENEVGVFLVQTIIWGWNEVSCERQTYESHLTNLEAAYEAFGFDITTPEGSGAGEEYFAQFQPLLREKLDAIEDVEACATGERAPAAPSFPSSIVRLEKAAEERDRLLAQIDELLEVSQ